MSTSHETSASGAMQPNAGGTILCPTCNRYHQPFGVCMGPAPFLPHAAAAGCICPPGANLQCENPSCPRKPPRPLTATGMVCR